MSDPVNPTPEAAAPESAAPEAAAPEAAAAEVAAPEAAAPEAAAPETIASPEAAGGAIAASPAVEAAAPVAPPPVEPEVRRGPGNYVESEGGRAGRVGSGVKPSDVDYKNIALLSRFLDRRGRILSRRKTRVTAKVQRRVSQAIKRARHLALLPYTGDQTRVVRKRR